MADLVGERGISPVFGVLLIAAMVVALATVAGVLLFDLTRQQDPAPAAKFDVESEDGGAGHVVRLEQGENLDGSQLTLTGAADPDVFAGRDVRAGDEATFFPKTTDVAVVWTGKHGTRHSLGSFEVDATLPPADHGCPWVDSETSGGSDKLDVDDEVVDCDATTAKDVEVTTGGVIMGDTDSGQVVDADGAQFYGDVTATDLVNLQDGAIHGDVSSDDDVKVDNATVDGSVTAADEIEIIGDSTVEGDVVGDTDLVKVDGSTVGGDVASDGTVKLLDATVRGDVYADDADFDCVDSTINGQDCSGYSPKDPDDR